MAVNFEGLILVKLLIFIHKLLDFGYYVCWCNP